MIFVWGVCVCEREGEGGDCGGPERVLDPLELELAAVVSHCHGCWAPDAGPLEEQRGSLCAHSSFSPSGWSERDAGKTGWSF